MAKKSEFILRPIVRPETWCVLCPKCREPMDDPVTGSQMWTDVSFEAQAGKMLQCRCRAQFSVPVPREARHGT